MKIMKNHQTILTVKIPRKLLEELELRIPKGSRSDFVREAIEEKLQKIPITTRIEKIEKKIEQIEDEIGKIKKVLVEFDVLTGEKEKINPYSFCRDEIDKEIVEVLLRLGGATTSEIAKQTGKNRWLILNRLKKLSQTSEKRFGKPLIHFLAVERMGKKRAWWIDENLLT